MQEICKIYVLHLLTRKTPNIHYADLDDGIGIDPDEQLCQHIVNEVKIDLIKSGLVSKAEKSFWQTVKRIVLLGINAYPIVKIHNDLFTLRTPLFNKWSGNLCKRITCRS
jgi:hypothetical protein